MLFFDDWYLYDRQNMERRVGNSPARPRRGLRRSPTRRAFGIPLGVSRSGQRGLALSLPGGTDP